MQNNRNRMVLVPARRRTPEELRDAARRARLMMSHGSVKGAALRAIADDVRRDMQKSLFNRMVNNYRSSSGARKTYLRGTLARMQRNSRGKTYAFE